ncbi:MAG: S1C family serine protease [Verrucomicrobiota bacterium]
MLIVEDTADYVKFKHADGLAKLPKDRILSGTPETDAAAASGSFDAAALMASIKTKVDSVMTRDGRTFLTKDLAEVQPNQLKFITDSGIHKIKFTDLPTDKAVALGWDKTLSDAQDSKDSVKAQEDQKKRALYLQAESVVGSGSFDGRIQPFQKLNAGWLCYVSERQVATVAVEAGRQYNGMTKQVEVATKNVQVDVSGPAEVALVWGLSDAIVLQRPKEAWSSQLYIVGKYKYGVLNGQGKEVPIYFTERNAAIAHLVKHGLGVVDDSAVTKGSDGKVLVKGWGTGFFVSKDGFIATNYHVVEDAKTIKVSTQGKVFDAKVVAKDESNDLAILKIEYQSETFLSVGSGTDVSIGDAVFTIGFPRPDSQGMNPKFTEGSISSMTGLGDSKSRYQVSVPIQPGNSGGALVSDSGAVIGVIVATLNSEMTIRQGSGLPQNVNYAVKSSYLSSLFTKAGVTTPPASQVVTPTKDRKTSITTAEHASVLIEIEGER